MDKQTYEIPVVAVPPSAVISAALIVFGLVFFLLATVVAKVGIAIWGLVG